ncbi:MAG: heavy metal translocating P-type ATPase [Tenericutes bacterium]|nr:heavy metal translocating P-type ATPase [Mycoplasmatota bacterium]
MKKIILKIDGMTCSACSSSLEKYLLKQDGINDALVNLVMSSASISYEDNITIDDLNRFVSEAGFKSLGIYDEQEKKDDNKNIYFIVNGLLALLVLYISMSHMVHLPVIPFLHMTNHPINYSVCLFIFSIYFIYFGWDIIISGIKNIKYKSPNMDTLVTLGVVSSFIFSTFNMIMILNGNNEYVENLYFESVCIILYLIKFGRYIDGISKEKTKDAIKGLVTITPKSAILFKNNKEKEVTIDEVKKGDILIVKPGNRFAVDGSIIKGNAHVDESFISGESLPVKKGIDDKVVAGSINLDGEVLYKAENIGRDSTISEIVRLVVEATNTKAPIARIADKVSGIFVPIVIVLAVITLLVHLILGFSFNESIVYFVTVLVCACPCALGLATPLAIVVSEGLCAKNGILVKKSDILENANKIDVIVFDKTGTLTYGNLRISKIINNSDYTNNDLMEIVSSLENKSTHPIASAFNNYATENKLKSLNVDEFKNIAGIGLKGIINENEYLIGNNKILQKYKIDNNIDKEEKELSLDGNSIVYVVENKKVIALIGVKDIIRSNAQNVINKLKQINKRIIMLTGDNETIANIIAKSIGIKEIIANVSPKDKSNKIKELKNKGLKVMMVGDGINDAPSLSISDIGVSLNSAIDIAADSADVILMRNDLNSIYNLFDISKKTLSNIKGNLFWAFFYNICMIPLASGLLEFANITMNPMIAGLSMTLSSFTVIINVLRLKRWKEK